MSMSGSLHDIVGANHASLDTESGNHSLQFNAKGGCYVSLFVPPHVAEHTAAAFNRAMQAVQDHDAIGKGWTYTTKSGVWHIRNPIGHVYHAQHDEITGDGDPAWMFAEASTLIGVMDEIDANEAEQAEEIA